MHIHISFIPEVCIWVNHGEPSFNTIDLHFKNIAKASKKNCKLIYHQSIPSSPIHFFRKSSTSHFSVCFPLVSPLFRNQETSRSAAVTSPANVQIPGDDEPPTSWCWSNPQGVSKKGGTPKSSILIGISIINHPFWGTPIFGNTHHFTIISLSCKLPSLNWRLVSYRLFSWDVLVFRECSNCFLGV